METAGIPREKIEIGSEPIFQYARRPEKSIEYLQNLGVGDGRISIQWWSSIVFYSAFSVTAGGGISTEGLKNSVGGLSLLNESGDCARLENARLFVYHFHAPDDYPSLMPALPAITEKLYIGPEWCIEGAEDESVSRDAYVIYERFPGGVIAFYPKGDEPGTGLWRNVSNSDGLIVVGKRSGVWRRLGDEYAEFHDVSLMLSGSNRSNAALSVERCHMDDALLCAYNMGPVLGMWERLCMVI